MKYLLITLTSCLILAVSWGSSSARDNAGGLRIVYTANTYGTVQPCPT